MFDDVEAAKQLKNGFTSFEVEKYFFTPFGVEKYFSTSFGVKKNIFQPQIRFFVFYAVNLR